MRLLSLAALLSIVSAGCGGSIANPSSEALDKSAVGKNKCVSDGDEHRLFLVESDATDLSSFEAKAGRDLVVVKYESCELKVLHGCSDDGIAGRYGSYKKPELTSGNLESLSVANQDELFAKLPLGAVTLGGEVSRGKTLELSYFVSGAVSATRDELYRDDIGQNPRCAGATHFVQRYNLGAFELASTDAAKVGATADVKGLGGGVKHESKADALKKGGSIASCSSMDQHACKVPIRVTLRAIHAGARPATSPAAGPPPETQGTLETAQSMMDGVKLRASAEEKLQRGDASACLADLDRAGSVDRQGVSVEANLLRSRCEMRAGRCDEGKKHYREAKAAWARKFDQSGLMNDATIAAEAEQMARSLCPTAAAGGVSQEQAGLAMLQRVVAAAAAKDVDRCISEGKALDKAAATPGAAADPIAKQAAVGGLRTAAMCAAEGGKCDDARLLWRGFARAFNGDGPAQADESFKINVAACAKK